MSNAPDQDKAAYNYKAARYAYDGEKYPDRVIYGSESYPRAALQSWMATEENSHVIGDFVWTAWDYIGEVGVGRWEISDESRPGPDLAFLTIQAVDVNGNPVFDENAEVTVKVLGNGTLLALGSADPKPDRVIPYGLESCPLFEGTAMAVIRSEAGAKGCMVEAALANGIKAQIPIGFSAVSEKAAPVQDANPGVLDLPLGKLLENEKAVEVLRQIFGSVLDSPMLESMKGMSLKKLTSMGGQTISPEAVKELEKLYE